MRACVRACVCVCVCASGGVVVSKLDKQTNTNEFETLW